MKTLKHWAPLAVAITILAGMVYAGVHQNYRQSANDPQIQVVQDLAAQFAAGQSQFNLPTGKSDISKSLAPVIMVMDDAGKTLYNSATLDGVAVVPPKGVLDYTRANGEDRVTWQPKPGVRMALVVVSFTTKATGKTGYVAAARSLREVESRIDSLGTRMLIMWFAALVASFIAQWFFSRKAVAPQA